MSKSSQASYEAEQERELIALEEQDEQYQDIINSEYPEEIKDLALREGVTIEEAWKIHKDFEQDQSDITEASRGQY